jgi:hypothetical protein
MTLLIALLLTISSVFTNLDLANEPVIQGGYMEQSTPPETVIGTSLVWDNGVVYEDGVQVCP